MPVFTGRQFGQEIGRQTQGVRALLLNQLQRKQQLEDAVKLLQVKQLIAQQGPQQQFLRQILGQFTQQPTQQPTAGIQPSGVVQPQAGVQPQLGGGRFGGGQFMPVPSISPTGGIGIKFERTPGAEKRIAVEKQRALQKEKGLAGESAAKLTMINQALSDLKDVEKLLFAEEGEGELIKGLAAAANVPGGRAFGIGALIPEVSPFGAIETRTKARQINSKMNNALEAKLRVETGAAATQEEFNRLQTRFGVTAFDTTASAKDKIRRLKDFMRNAIITIDPTGRFIYKSKDIKLDKELNVDIPQLQSLGLDPARFEIIGEE